jgi:hypothetical protein
MAEQKLFQIFLTIGGKDEKISIRAASYDQSGNWLIFLDESKNTVARVAVGSVAAVVDSSFLD